MRKKWQKIDYEKFVIDWQTSKNILEVVKKTGRADNHCYSIASFLRRNGVPLKRFRQELPPLKDRLNFPALSSVAMKKSHASKR